MGMLAGQLRDSPGRRRADAPSDRVARIIWILLRLLYDGALDFATCIDRFGISRREFQRDLKHLREIGETCGFTISPITGGRVFLNSSNRRAELLRIKSRDVTETLGRIAAAIGGPIEREIRDATGVAPTDAHRGFLHLRGASPIDNARVAVVFEFLKDAAAGPARVEFSYTSARGPRTTRRVEPYHVVARAGRCYLIGYDLTRRAWRQFALDAFSGPMRKEGTFTLRPVPERYLAERAVGWISGPKTLDVTIRLSPVIAASVTARKWQQNQRIAARPDGSAEITLAFDDLGEAVRWALSFGAEAVVVAPPEAIAFAQDTIARIERAYSGEGTDKQALLTG
ncbi:MAG: helix-turn-helix transcriptional regulator [Vulcanimicrobiaceae bacterium]